MLIFWIMQFSVHVVLVLWTLVRVVGLSRMLTALRSRVRLLGSRTIVVGSLPWAMIICLRRCLM